MAKKNEAVKLVTIETKGSIVELGGISGPVINPTILPISTIVALLNGHKKVFEVNPANKDEKIRLSLKNVRTENFATPIVSPAPSVLNTKTVATKKETTSTTSKASTSDVAKTEKSDKNASVPADGDFTKK